MTQLDRLYRSMVRIRRFELAVAELYRQKEIPGFVHLSTGQEASAVGVADCLGPGDRITTTHRGHAHLLARGVPPAALMAELFGKASGVNGGYGGSMHAMSLDHGVLGANGIVGAGLPLAVGSAFEQSYRAAENITVAFFGEGALSTGNAHESLVLASAMALPVLFVCEFNGWIEFTSYSDVMPFRSPVGWAEQYGLAAMEVADPDVRKIRNAAAQAADLARRGRPTFLLVHVTRLRGHYEGDPQTYRPDEEGLTDPVALVGEELPPQDRERIDAEVDSEIAEAVAAAREAPWPEIHPEDA